MVKTPVVSTALAAIALVVTNNSNVYAFQLSSSRQVALAPSMKRNYPLMPASTSLSQNQRRSTSISMAMAESSGEESQSTGSLFRSASQRTRRGLQKMRRSFTILLASFAFFLSSTRVMHTPPAHAASAAAAATTSSLSLKQKLNPFRTRSADEMIDAYVRDRLFADDEYDPVESAYREAFADAGSAASGKEGSATSSGAYPTLLAETAGSALGQQKSVSSILSTSTRSLGSATGASAAGGSEKSDGFTAVLIKASDLLQSKLKVSASISYYILAATGLVGVCVVPGMAGVIYQGIQRLQIDKSEMKMYGKISDMDATSKRVTDDDDDDDDEE